MKKLVFVFTLFVVTAQAQELKQIPQISISGEGKILVAPDIVIIQLVYRTAEKIRKK